MKKGLILIFLILFNYSAHSQILIALLLGDKLNNGSIEFGLDGGYDYSRVSGLEGNKNLGQFNLGFYFDIRMKNQWFLDTGVLVKSTLGIEDLTINDLESLNATIYRNQYDELIEGKYSQKLNYFLIPALAKYKFKNNIYAEGGLQFGWMHKSWIEFNSRIDGNSARIKEKNKDQINWFDMGVSAGAGYRLLNGYGWTLGVRYYYGFTNVYKNISGTKNSTLFLKVNIPVGVNKKMKEKAEEQKNLIKEKKKRKKESKKKNKL